MIGDLEGRSQFITGLHALADFYQKHPDAYYDGMQVSLSMYVNGRNARQVLTAMARLFDQYEESYDEKYASVARRFGQKVKIELFAPRGEVCLRKVVGARVEPALVIPAIHEVRIPERLVEVVEWTCSPLVSERSAREGSTP
jgi:hypothetical protein